MKSVRRNLTLIAAGLMTWGAACSPASAKKTVTLGPVSATAGAPKSQPLAPVAQTLFGSLLPPTPSCPDPAVDLKVLVLSADGTEVDLAGIRHALDAAGVPYSVRIASQSPGSLTPDVLATGCHANYQGVILTNGALAYSPSPGVYVSALSPAEWQSLYSFEARFGIRMVSWYTFPGSDYGLSWTGVAKDTSVTPISGTFTPAGAPLFANYIRTTSPIVIQKAYTYLAATADASTTPILVDDQNNVLGAVSRRPDGREVLALTFDSNQYLTHNLVLSHGLINWVTKGLFVGERRIRMSAQVDDFFLEDDIWGGSPTTVAYTYRNSGADYAALLLWQTLKQAASPVSRNLKLDQAFNGAGAFEYAPTPDTLTPLVTATASSFKWISHTYTHANLDAIDYVGAKDELQKNIRAANKLGLTPFSHEALVTPDVSGLTNPAFLQAAYDLGLRYLVTDTSKPGYDNPSPNSGIYNPIQPAILMIPRHPNNLFYNVSTPAEWVDEYNYIYRAYWGRDLTYAEILDNQSDLLMSYLLKADNDPWMFHQPNLRAYDGVHSLLGDLIDATLIKYEAIFTAPIESPTMVDLGKTFADHMALATSGVTATAGPGPVLTLRANAAVTVPVTGLTRAGAVLYAGQPISMIKVTPGVPVVVPLN